MTYRFKPLDELYWSVLTAGSIVLLTALVTLDPEAVADWRSWAVALGGGIVRASAGAALDYVRRSMTAGPDVTSADDLADRIFRLPPTERKYLVDAVERRARIEAAELISRPPAWLPPEPR